ncbi:hypothetical protein EKK58_00970 [Candidatus Dependentiae bacterium]|nr:MAG: hypothetical protein EKK58_00970 [Candidatus Dependentiae bacterium]
MRKITLQRVDQSPDPEVTDTYAQTYGMTLTVTAAYDMPAEVFVKQRISPDGTQDVFAAVASAQQLQDLPVNEPGGDTSYFRVSSVTVQGMNQAALDEIYRLVQEEIQLLVRNLDALDNQAVPSTTCEITVGSLEYL